MLFALCIKTFDIDEHAPSLPVLDIFDVCCCIADYTTDRLYWVDAKQHQICTSDLSGNKREIVLTSFSYLKHPFAITVFEDSVYWTDWETETIHKANKFTGKNVENVAVSLYSPMDVHIYHEQRQPSGMSALNYSCLFCIL